jgi:cystathionine beta-synthase
MPLDLTKIKYAESIIDTIGRTPQVRLQRVTRGVKATVLAKLDYLNPGGSVKDRIGIFMIDAAEKSGALKPGGTIVECTSGNTGVGLAMVAAIRGYKTVFTMPDKVSGEKIRLLKSYGAEVIMCPYAVPPESEESYYSVARRIVERTPNSVLVNQYHNPQNPEAHYRTTGPEIWEDTGGQIDYFVCSIGTCGTISGVGRFLKEKKPSVKIIGADPEGSILRQFFYERRMTEARPYLVEGIGEDFIPGTFQPVHIDEIVTVGDKESFSMARRLSREEGLLVGGSGGTAAHAAIELARTLPKDKLVVVLLPDSGERYLSKFHSDEWMRENRMLDTSHLTVGELLRGKSGKLPPVVHVRAGDTVQRALELMKEYGVTQMPVGEGDTWVGRLSEGDTLDALLSGKISGDQPVTNIMGDPFPTLKADADCTDALKLFSDRHMAIVILDGHRTAGIITKSDLVEYMLSELD